MKLNLGCGRDVREGYVNIDVCNPWELDVVIHDLNKVPYPFEDNTFDEVYASHIIEHLNDFHQTIMEIHRICKPNAKVIVKAPFFPSTKFFGDPSHKIPFSYRTFDN
ncbi:methyltransferase domain-containing protein, partial [bacterium]|nr:methyltransferase domain-containing protein [bacterium]